MARTKSENTTVEETEVIEKEFDLNKKVNVISIADWITGFKRIVSFGEQSVIPNGTFRIAREEIVAQVNNNNKLFVGNGNGEHATYYIDDKETRDYLEFTNQKRIDKSFVDSLFAIENMEEFKKAVKDSIVTRAEKIALKKIVTEHIYNDYYKMTFIMNHCNNVLF